MDQAGRITLVLTLLLLAAVLLWFVSAPAKHSTTGATLNNTVTASASTALPESRRSRKRSSFESGLEETEDDGLFASPRRSPARNELILAPPTTEETLEPSLIYITPIPSPTLAPPAPVPTEIKSISDLHLDALREVQKLSEGGSGSSRIGGARSTSDRSGSSTLLPGMTPTATPESTTSPLSRVSGQARGFTLLALMHPRARVSMERNVRTLLDAEVGSLYLAALSDGSFAKDIPYLSDVVRRLNSNGRNLTLILYLTNGASMRRYDSAVFTAGFNLIEPEAFRFLITTYDEIRREFQNMAREARPVFELNRSLNPQNRNVAIVMLEDNLDRTSYSAMRDLAKTELSGVADFIRNPCSGCYSGNDSDPVGDGLESHSAGDLIALGARDGFSMDGTSYAFPGEAPSANQLGFEQVKILLDEARSRGLRYFGLWRAGRQGLGSVLTPADQRDYEVATDEQVQLEIELLRYGLEPQ